MVDEGCYDLRALAAVRRRTPTRLNLELAKAGGLREALRMVHAARALGLRVMLDCMIESQLAMRPGRSDRLAGRPGRGRPPPAAARTAIRRLELDAGRVLPSCGARVWAWSRLVSERLAIFA